MNVQSTIAATVRPDAIARNRCVHSIRVAGSRDGRNCPWQSGQSGQPRPEPVTRTMPPHTTTRNDATRLAYTSERYRDEKLISRAALMRDVFLQRTGAVNDGNPGEVVGLRRRGRRPLEGVGLPRVIAGDPPVLENDAREEVEEEYG